MLQGEGGTMPWVVRDAVDDINRAVGRRWQGWTGCCRAGRASRGLRGAVRDHRGERPPGRPRRLPPRARPGRHAEPDLGRGDPVLADPAAARGRHVRRPRRPARAMARSPGRPARGRRRGHRGDDHLAGPRRQRGERAAAARAAGAHRDRGAARRARRRGPARPARPPGTRPALVIREAGPSGRVRAGRDPSPYDALFGAAILRPATEALVRAETQAALAARPAWAWLAERDGQPVGLVHVQPPEQSAGSPA